MIDSAKDSIIKAAQRRHLTQISSQSLLANLNATTMPATIGEQVNKVESGIPCIVNLVIDSTGSLDGYEPIIVKAINDTMRDFQDLRDKTGQEIYVQVMEFSQRPGLENIRIITSWIHVQDFVDLTISDYTTDGLTPLNQATYDGATSTTVFGASLFTHGATGVQEITIVISDGMNNVWNVDTATVKSFLKELLIKPHFVPAFIGVGNEANFRRVALELGFPDGNILTVDKTAGGIVKALKLVSSSVGGHSQSVQSGVQPANTTFFGSVS